MNYKVAYAFLESHFSKSKKDIMDIYSDMLLLFSNNKTNNTKKILEKMGHETWINVPYEVWKSLLKKLRKKWYIDYKDFEVYILTDNGENYRIESTKNYENEWFDDIENDLKELGITASLKDIVEMFLKSDITKVDFSVDEWLELESSENILNKFFKYLSDTKRKNIDKYNKIIWLLYTWFLSKLLVQRDIDWIFDNFNGLEVYLDTNIIISLLWYHEESVNIMTREIVEKLKWMNAKLYVSSLTLNELNKLLDGYKPENYFSNYPVDHIYYNMKLKNKSKSDINIIIENIESFMEENDIEINYITSKDSLSEDRSFSEKTQSLSQYKKKSSQKIIEHDVLMQIFIKRQRYSLHSIYSKSIDKSKIIFLTLDNHFSSWNLTLHQDWTVPEIIHIESIATYLWLKNPDIVNISEIRQFLNWNMKKHVISNNLRESFLWELGRKVESKEISHEDCAALLAMESTKSSLLELEKEVEKTWNLDFSKILSEESIQKIHWEKNSAKRKIEWLYLANQTIKKKQEDVESQILIAKENIQISAEKKAKILLWTVKIAILLLVAYLSYLLSNLWIFKFLWEYSQVITTVGTTASLLWINFTSPVKKLFEKLYNKTVDAFVKKGNKIFNKKNKK